MARGPLSLVTDLQARARPTGNAARIPAPHDTGLETALGSVGRDVQRMGTEVGKLADKAAKREGEADGRQAGLDPEFRTRADGTLYSDAFDKAGLDIAETRLKTALEAGLEGAREKHGSNAKALAGAIDGVSKGIIDTAPEELRPRLTLMASSKRLAYMRQAQREHIAETRTAQTGALQEELQRTMRGLSQRAFGLGLDAEADKAVAGEVAALQTALGRRGIDGKPLVAPERAAKLIEHAKAEIMQSRMLGAFDRLESPEAKARFIEEMENGWKKGEGPAKDLDLDGMRQMRGLLEGELRRADAGRGVATRAIANEIKGFKDLAESGYAPKPEDLARVKAIVAGSDGAQAEALQIAEATLMFQQGARRMHPGALDDWVVKERTRMSAEGGSKLELARLEMAEKLLGEMRKGLKEDPNEWAHRTGLVPMKPLDFSSPTTLSETLKERIATAEQVGQAYDQDAVYLRPDERRKLVAMAAPGGAALTGVVETITRGAGGASDRILRELWNEAPTLAMLGGHARAVGNTSVAADVADGVALMRTKDFKSLGPGPATSREWAIEAHGGALSGLPKSEQAMIDATNYAYNVRLQRQGKTEDKELWNRTFMEIAGQRVRDGVTYGGTAQWRGKWVLLPPDVRADRFDDLMRSIRVSDFGEDGPRNAKGAATEAELRGATLQPLGNGRFRLNVGDDDTPVYLGDRSGRPFVLDLNALKPKLTDRRPDLYIDGRRPTGAQRRLTGTMDGFD